MKNVGNGYRFAGRLLWLLVAIFIFPSFSHAGSIVSGKGEPTFPLLQTKTGVYTNVTVTQQTKEWIFILHSTGVCNIKIGDLSTETKVSLGIIPRSNNGVVEAEEAPATGSSASTPSHALAHMPHFKFADLKKFAEEWRTNGKQKFNELTAGNPMIGNVLLCILGVVYIFVSTCFWLICRKTHNSPGPLVWVPVFQLIPLLRAANMPRVWFFAYFVPVLNIVAQIVWCVKIVKSRGKSPWVAFLLLLPVTNFFAFLYLAFSPSAPVRLQSNEVLSLQFS